MKTKTVIITAITVFVGFVGTVLINGVYGNATTVGEPYTVSFSYCGSYAGVGGTRHCNLWLVGHERRINTKVQGLIWDYDSYKLVDR